MFEKEKEDSRSNSSFYNKPNSFKKKKNKYKHQHKHTNKSLNTINYNSISKKKTEEVPSRYSVSTTTSKTRTPLPPNQEKKINNKKAAKKKREKLLLEINRKDNNETPLSSSSDSSTTRALLDEMILTEESGPFKGRDTSSEDSEQENILMGALGEYRELPTDALILNTENVERIIEQIVTDIESEVEAEYNSDEDDENEFDGGEGNGGGGVQRYFLENSGPKCFNCGESGHIIKDCPATSTVPCNLCGQLGHSRSNCPQEVCYNCSRPGHQSKACPARRKRRVYDDDLCNRCDQPGHLARECSMAWRGYIFARDLPRAHSTFLDELRGLRKRCYNCASISHFGDDCPNRRRPNYSVFHIPDFDYLDRVIIRIKSVAKSTTINSAPLDRKEPANAKQKQADNFNKILRNEKEKLISKANNQSTPNPRANTNEQAKKQVNTNTNANANANTNTIKKQHKHEDSDINIKHRKFDTLARQVIAQPKPVDDYEMTAEEDFSTYNNRQVFMQSRGVSLAAESFSFSESEASKIKKPIPFVRYEENQVRVKEFEDESDNFRKGSSGNKRGGGKPTYRGGYK